MKPYDKESFSAVSKKDWLEFKYFETKLNEDNKLSYQLVYMFSLKFDIDWVTVYDVDIPSSTWDRPEMYVLTSKWVNKISLYEYIEAMK